jgi:cytochrome c2
MRLTDRRVLNWLAAPVVAVIALAGFGSMQIEKVHQKAATARILTGGDPARAPWLITRYGCGGCHTIADIPGADGQVGPPLQRLLERVYIGGTAQNTADNLVLWIVEPQKFSAHTAMPPTGISDAEARDIAAYLYAH